MIKKYSLPTATSVVIANMIGVGVFTSLGFQVMDIKSGTALILLWVFGGIIALCGALAYAEASSRFPQNGGEYALLSKLIHPIPGFLSGWVSAVIGFAAPVAASALAFGTYLSKSLALGSQSFLNLGLDKWLAMMAVLVITLIQTLSRKTGASFQVFLTAFKVLFILFLVIIGFVMSKDLFIAGTFDANITEISSSSFAVSMFFVMYAYSGWNASAYIAGEIENPKKNLPRSLFFGTLIVAIFYILLNYVFLQNVPIEQMVGKVEIGHEYALGLLGDGFAGLMSGMIAFMLLSSISSMVIAGPRVVAEIGSKINAIQFLSKTDATGIPKNAILFQSILTLFYLLTSTFDQVIIMVGFTLNLFATLTVAAILIRKLRNKEEKNTGFNAPLFPLPHIIFLGFSTWVLYFGLTMKPYESLMGLGITAFGLVVYYLMPKNEISS